MTLFHNMSTQMISTKRGSVSLAASKLVGHSQTNKQDTLKAVDLLVKYKTTVQDFTDEIVEFWPLPRQIMEGYQLKNAEQLNEWLDNLSG